MKEIMKELNKIWRGKESDEEREIAIGEFLDGEGEYTHEIGYYSNNGAICGAPVFFIEDSQGHKFIYDPHKIAYHND